MTSPYAMQSTATAAPWYRSSSTMTREFIAPTIPLDTSVPTISVTCRAANSAAGCVCARTRACVRGRVFVCARACQFASGVRAHACPRAGMARVHATPTRMHACMLMCAGMCTYASSSARLHTLNRPRMAGSGGPWGTAACVGGRQRRERVGPHLVADIQQASLRRRVLVAGELGDRAVVVGGIRAVARTCCRCQAERPQRPSPLHPPRPVFSSRGFVGAQNRNGGQDEGVGVAGAGSATGRQRQARDPYSAEVSRRGARCVLPGPGARCPSACWIQRPPRVTVRARVRSCRAGRSRAEEGVATKAARTIMEGIASKRLASVHAACRAARVCSRGRGYDANCSELRDAHPARCCREPAHVG
jgi:hypothetical protein